MKRLLPIYSAEVAPGAATLTLERFAVCGDRASASAEAAFQSQNDYLERLRQSLVYRDLSLAGMIKGGVLARSR